jgi:hypothetical protein
MEVTLSDAECPVSLLADCQDFKFQSLSKWFKFRKATKSASKGSAIARLLLTRTPMAGTRRIQSGRRLYNNMTDSDTVLNDLKYGALRELTRRMQA